MEAGAELEVLTGTEESFVGTQAGPTSTVGLESGRPADSSCFWSLLSFGAGGSAGAMLETSLVSTGWLTAPSVGSGVSGMGRDGWQELTCTASSSWGTWAFVSSPG